MKNKINLNLLFSLLGMLLLFSFSAFAFTPSAGQLGFATETVSATAKQNVELTVVGYPNIVGGTAIQNKFYYTKVSLTYDATQFTYVSASSLLDAKYTLTATNSLGQVDVIITGGVGALPLTPKSTELFKVIFTSLQSGTITVKDAMIKKDSSATVANGITDFKHASVVTVSGAQCTNVCIEDAKKCSGNKVQSCTKGTNGCTAWVDGSDCGTQTCSNGVCVAKTPNDDAGDTLCKEIKGKKGSKPQKGSLSTLAKSLKAYFTSSN